MLQRKRHKTESTHFQKVNEKRGIGIISKEKPKKHSSQKMDIKAVTSFANYVLK